MTAHNSLHCGSINPQVESWITDVINRLEADRFMFQTGAVSNSTRKHYNILSSGDGDMIHDYARKSASSYFLKGMLSDFIDEINQSHAVPKKLALSVFGSKLQVWAEVNDEDVKTEDALYIAEAKINAKYEPYNMAVSMTLVDASDNFTVPSRYVLVPFQEKISGDLSRSHQPSEE